MADSATAVKPKDVAKRMLPECDGRCFELIRDLINRKERGQVIGAAEMIEHLVATTTNEALAEWLRDWLPEVCDGYSMHTDHKLGFVALFCPHTKPYFATLGEILHTLDFDSFTVDLDNFERFVLKTSSAPNTYSVEVDYGEGKYNCTFDVVAEGSHYTVKNASDITGPLTVGILDITDAVRQVAAALIPLLGVVTQIECEQNCLIGIRF